MFLTSEKKSVRYKYQLILPREIICDYSENHTKLMHAICVEI